MDSEGDHGQFRTVARGHWHPPGSSRREEALLLARGGTLIVRSALRPTGDPVAVNDVRSVAISDRVGNIPRRITFSSGALFETADNEAIDRFLKGRRSPVGAWIHGIERFHPRLILLVALVFVLAGAVYRYALPVMVEVAVAVTPEVVPRVLSEGTLSSLDRAVFAQSELPAERRAEIGEGFAALAARAERGPDGYSLHFRKGEAIGPNAFALPSGTVVITDELVELAKGDTAMILGVLAHEIGHVDLKHSLRGLYRAAGTAGLIMLVAGDVGAAMEDILANSAALLSLSYSREAESEADHYSVMLMSKAGYDPMAIARFFSIVEEKFDDDGQTSIFSTHPGTPGRRQRIEDWAKALE